MRIESVVWGKITAAYDSAECAFLSKVCDEAAVNFSSSDQDGLARIACTYATAFAALAVTDMALSRMTADEKADLCEELEKHGLEKFVPEGQSRTICEVKDWLDEAWDQRGSEPQ
jgi:hypothetical protein